MNYELSADQAAVKELFEGFCNNEIAPHAHDLDGAHAGASAKRLVENCAAAAGSGYHAMFFDEEYGGTCRDLIAQAVAGEALAKACPSTYLSLQASVEKFGGTLSAFGTPSQKKAYLPDLVKGRIIGTAAAYESETGSDILSMRATAAQRDDVWILNGTKSFVVNASVADVFLVYAATAPPSGDGPSVTCFIVNKGAPGMGIGPEYETMGFRGVPICDVVFKDCEVTGDMVLGDRNAGGEIFRQAAEAGKTGAAVCSLGIAAACLEEASGHSKRRRSFGRLINRYQEVAFKLSDMVIMTDLSRLLIYKALRARETGDPEADVLASCAKVFAAESATRAADYAMQIFGGHGYLKGGPVERLYRNAKLGELIDGTSEIHRVFIAGRLVERFG